jgi:hypothetical protein
MKPDEKYNCDLTVEQVKSFIAVYDKIKEAHPAMPRKVIMRFMKMAVTWQNSPGLYQF